VTGNSDNATVTVTAALASTLGADVLNSIAANSSGITLSCHFD
jgi:hypothetical protein